MPLVVWNEDNLLSNFSLEDWGHRSLLCSFLRSDSDFSLLIVSSTDIVTDSSTSSFANNTLSTNPSDWMLAPSLMRWDPAMEEPYLVLPSFADLRLTPWREGDGEAAVSFAIYS